MDKQRVDAIYNSIKDGLLDHRGEIVAIEPESGEYFIGVDINEACDKALLKHPTKQFFFKRIGAKAAFFIGVL